MAIFLYCLALVGAALAAILFRNDWVFHIRMEALAIVYDKHSPIDWRKFERGDYMTQFWDLRKWTLKQFYPELA